MRMSRRTLILLPIAGVCLAQAWLLPPAHVLGVDRGRMIVAFVSAGLFCVSWLLDGDQPGRDE
jgi:hypothetical protein